GVGQRLQDLLVGGPEGLALTAVVAAGQLENLLMAAALPRAAPYTRHANFLPLRTASVGPDTPLCLVRRPAADGSTGRRRHGRHTLAAAAAVCGSSTSSSAGASGWRSSASTRRRQSS